MKTLKKKKNVFVLIMGVGKVVYLYCQTPQNIIHSNRLCDTSLNVFIRRGLYLIRSRQSSS